MKKLTSIIPVFVDEIPAVLEWGAIYISKKYNSSSHLCACGCKGLTVLPIGDPEKGVFWQIAKNKQGKVTISPSIGNQKWPCRSHYLIQNNLIVWLDEN